MKKLLLIFILCLFANSLSAQAINKTPDVPPKSITFAEARQTIVVTTENWETPHGKLQRFGRAAANAKWRKVGAPIQVVVGKNGLGWGVGMHATQVFQPDQPLKKEGDGKSPAGIFALPSAFGSAPETEMAWIKMPYTKLIASTECVDDVKSGKYNLIADKSQVGNYDWQSSEKMLAVGAQYEYGVFVAHNSNPAVKGKGSCIFLHIWKDENTGTAGCSAMPRKDILTILHWLDADKNPVLIQLPKSDYSRLKKSWKLPKIQ